MTDTSAVRDLRRSLDEGAMRRGQVIAVLIAILIAGLDGYDVQAMAFVAPVVSKAWAVHKATLGLVLASSLFGMAAGSLGLTPLADVFGRRPTVLGGLVLMIVGTTFSALSHSVPALAASRALTGVGIGVMVSLTTTISAEFANVRRRGLAVASTTAGFGFGGVTGGLIAAAILRGHSWEWVFGVASAIASLLLVVAFFGLPESPIFLLDRSGDAALKKLNRVLSRLGQPTVADLPLRPKTPRVSYRAMFTPGTTGLTIRFAVIYILIATAAYYMLSWLPQIVADAGFPASTASMVSAGSGLIGVGAGVLFGLLASRIGPTRLASGAMIGLGAGLASLGFVPPTLAFLMLAAGVCSFFMAASTAVFYATMAMSFPPLTRVSGLGFVMGFGRLCSGLGPFLAGLMFSVGFTRMTVSLAFGAAAVVAGILVATGPRKSKLSEPEVETGLQTDSPPVRP